MTISRIVLLLFEESRMTTIAPIEYGDASPQVRAVYDDIKKTRNVPDVNNFWSHAAAHVAEHKRSDGAWRARRAHQGADLRSGVGDQWLRLLHCHAHGCGPQGGHDRRYVRRTDGCRRNGQ